MEVEESGVEPAVEIKTVRDFYGYAGQWIFSAREEAARCLINAQTGNSS